VIIGVPKEIYPGDRRVALVPAVLPTLTKAGFEVHIQSGAGVEAGYPDSQYSDKGAKLVADRAEVFAADIVVQILCYGSNDVTGKQDVPFFRRDQILIGFLRPFGSLDVVQEIARAGVTAFSVELMPRTTPRPKHGRALLDGNSLWIQGGAVGRRFPPAHLSHAHDRGWNRHTRPASL